MIYIYICMYFTRIDSLCPTQICVNCRKLKIPLYAEAQQFHLIHVQCNFDIA